MTKASLSLWKQGNKEEVNQLKENKESQEGIPDKPKGNQNRGQNPNPNRNPNLNLKKREKSFFALQKWS